MSNNLKDRKLFVWYYQCYLDQHKVRCSKPNHHLSHYHYPMTNFIVMYGELNENCDGIHENYASNSDWFVVEDSKHWFNIAFKAAKMNNYRMKTQLGMGNPQEADKYLKLYQYEKNRKKFAGQAVDFLKSHKLSGLDFQWIPMSNAFGFIDLLKELRTVFDDFENETHKMVLSVTIPHDINISESEMSSLTKYCDFITVKTHEYNTEVKNTIQPNAPLYGNRDNNTHSSINKLISAGVPKSKFVMTISTTGHCFVSRQPEFDQPSLKTFSGPLTKTNGMLAYHEIVDIVDKTWNIQFDETTAQAIASKDATHKYKGKLKDTVYEVIVYDNEDSMKRKVEYMQSRELAGMAMWTINGDEFRRGKSLTKHVGQFL